MQSLARAAIYGTGAYLPQHILDNAALERMVDTDDTWIRERTGIRERRIAHANEATVDLAEQASRLALARAGLAPEDLDLIILATVTPDQWVPPASCLLQHRLGAKKAAAFDLNAACSGFLYGLTVANQMIASGNFRYVLVIGAETLSRVIDYTDRNTCVLFGDGAGAAVLGPARRSEGIFAVHLGADGAGGDLIQIPGGGSRIPPTHQSIDERQHFVQMKGREVFKLAVRSMLSSTDAALAKAGFKRTDIDWVVPHQANLRILRAMVQRLGLEQSQVIVTLDRHGNTSAASVPLALAEGVEQGRIKKDQLLLLTGFGAGLTWGSAIVRY